MKTETIDGKPVHTCPPTCDNCDERFTCLDAGPLLPKKSQTLAVAPWPPGVGVTMGKGYIFKQNDWHFKATAADCPNNIVQLTCETADHGTFYWVGTVQQLQRGFKEA